MTHENSPQAYHVHENPDPIVIRDKDGRLMLAMRSDGTWEVGPEDAPEAARLFAEHVAQLLPMFSPLLARLEAAEQKRDEWRVSTKEALEDLVAVKKERDHYRFHFDQFEQENERLREALERIERGTRPDQTWANLSREEMQQLARAALAARTEAEA